MIPLWMSIAVCGERRRFFRLWLPLFLLWMLLLPFAILALPVLASPVARRRTVRVGEADRALADVREHAGNLDRYRSSRRLRFHPDRVRRNP
jgi:hypothetical protein